MKLNFLFFVALITTFLCACGSPPAANNASAAKLATSPTPIPTASVPKNGDYNGKGVVTKINLDLGSVELNHEEIKDMMPAMQMEFNVSNKKLLNDLKVGDKVDFVLRYKDPTETIVAIKKIQ